NWPSLLSCPATHPPPLSRRAKPSRRSPASKPTIRCRLAPTREAGHQLRFAHHPSLASVGSSWSLSRSLKPVAIRVIVVEASKLSPNLQIASFTGLVYKALKALRISTHSLH
ncbi:hypothetical protein HN51_047861, partial [Arachis hypogaea]